MDEIFRQATNVCAWIGAENVNSNEAMRFISRILDFAKFDELTKTASSSSRAQWEALGSFKR
jgi:hypothetical protein